VYILCLMMMVGKKAHTASFARTQFCFHFQPSIHAIFICCIVCIYMMGFIKWWSRWVCEKLGPYSFTYKFCVDRYKNIYREIPYTHRNKNMKNMWSEFGMSGKMDVAGFSIVHANRLRNVKPSCTYLYKMYR